MENQGQKFENQQTLRWLLWGVRGRISDFSHRMFLCIGQLRMHIATAPELWFEKLGNPLPPHNPRQSAP
jgi:hypothetical protein